MTLQSEVARVAKANTRLVTAGVDYRLVRAAMVLVFLFFGYTKWHPYAVDELKTFITSGPLISWLYPVFGARGATKFLGASEWTIAALLYSGFWDKRLGVLGALGASFTFFSTLTIIPFLPDGWVTPAAGWPPAMKGNVAFLVKDVVLLALSVYLLRQDLLRVSAASEG